MRACVRVCAWPNGILHGETSEALHNRLALAGAIVVRLEAVAKAEALAAGMASAVAVTQHATFTWHTTCDVAEDCPVVLPR